MQLAASILTYQFPAGIAAKRCPSYAVVMADIAANRALGPKNEMMLHVILCQLFDGYQLITD
ncbi:MAG: hypothetical protein QXX41_12825 [Nitrososphaerota archaeon]